jgi:tetratricopeptide (TPR) repeat protein
LPTGGCFFLRNNSEAIGGMRCKLLITSVLVLIFLTESDGFMNVIFPLCRVSPRVAFVPRLMTTEEGGTFVDGDDFAEDSVKKEKKVKMFGAWLDSTVAGRDSLSAVEDEVTDELYQKVLRAANFDKAEARQKLESFLQRRRKANDFFRDGVKSMKSGRYRSAVDAFSQAIFNVPEGVQSREGGEYSIWLAQALDADGQKGKALMTIRACKAHNDRDVQRVAAGVEYIMLAPKLQTSSESFTWIDYNKIEDIKDSGRKSYAPVKKMPEKYSLEWYMLQKPKRISTRDDSSADAGAALAASATILAGLAIYVSYIAPAGSLPGNS